MSPPLPILRLPYLAMKPILEMMDFPEIVSLSVCSERTRRKIVSTKKFPSVKNLINEEKSEMHFMDLLHHLRLEISHSEFIKQVSYDIISDLCGTEIKVKFHDRQASIFLIQKIKKPKILGDPDGILLLNQKPYGVHYESNCSHMNLIYDTLDDALITLINYFKQVFDLQINRLVLASSAEYFEQWKAVINWLNQSFISISEIYFVSYKIDDFYIKSILSSINAVDSYTMDFKPSCMFQCIRYFNSHYFELKQAEWFTFYNLQLTDCAIIKIMDSQLTNENMKEYLRQWIDGSYDDLKDLAVEMREEFDAGVLLGEMSTDTFILGDNCIIIKRSDGKTATIESKAEEMTNWFRMIIS